MKREILLLYLEIIWDNLEMFLICGFLGRWSIVFICLFKGFVINNLGFILKLLNVGYLYC